MPKILLFAVVLFLSGYSSFAATHSSEDSWDISGNLSRNVLGLSNKLGGIAPITESEILAIFDELTGSRSKASRSKESDDSDDSTTVSVASSTSAASDQYVDKLFEFLEWALSPLEDAPDAPTVIKNNKSLIELLHELKNTYEPDIFSKGLSLIYSAATE